MNFDTLSDIATGVLGVLALAVIAVNADEIGKMISAIGRSTGYFTAVLLSGQRSSVSVQAP